ncbi:MAG: threonylcarbamoyl-AMP synthase [Bacteroidetes bacterium]|nr:threonylcarbamoyl-AMP synthase [Bacteroidota bacterium]
MTLITKNIHRAIEQLKRDELVSIPTETVYGLAGNAYSSMAIKKIFELKQRPFHNPLIVHIKSIDYLNQVASNIPPLALKLAENFWPGPLTLVLKKQSTIPEIVTSGKDTVAIRMPNHPLTLSLLQELDFPLAAPSANPFGSISPTNAKHVFDYFGDELEVILDGGNCEHGIESTIIGFENDQYPILYRYGTITVSEIEDIIGKVKISTSNNSDPIAPGMLSRHYAPQTKTILTDNVYEFIESLENQKIGILSFNNPVSHKNILHQEVLSPSGNLYEATKNLYAAMHRLDKNKLDIIIAERFPDKGLGKTINDKLERASK